MNDRMKQLLPGGVPKYVRCYDNGGETADRYTVVYTGRYRKDLRRDEFQYVGMSAEPFHPQGVGMHGSSPEQIDRPRSSHLGRRISFEKLPEDCRRLVLADYRDLWSLSKTC
jgi:hypothetical protein